MATPKTLRPLLRGARPHQTSRIQPHQQRRAFLPNPFASLNPLASTASSSDQHQTLTATRTLPYASHPIYSIISDVSSYSSFLPYCQSSSVTRWSAPDPTYKRRWPGEAKITVGFGQFTETFSSRVFCVPGKIVESVGGSTQSSLDRQAIAHHLEEGDEVRAYGDTGGLLTHLSSRWTVEPRAEHSTEVTLSLEFAFSNPLYTALSANVTPKVADVMIKAFEERVKSLLENNPEMARASLERLEGSQVKR